MLSCQRVSWLRQPLTIVLNFLQVPDLDIEVQLGDLWGISFDATARGPLSYDITNNNNGQPYMGYEATDGR